jgi:hypothetical protein
LAHKFRFIENLSAANSPKITPIKYFIAQRYRSIRPKKLASLANTFVLQTVFSALLSFVLCFLNPFLIDGSLGFNRKDYEDKEAKIFKFSEMSSNK